MPDPIDRPTGPFGWSLKIAEFIHNERPDPVGCALAVGRESHVFLGAVIDEEMAGRIEVCVLGTSDMGGRGAIRRPVTNTRRSGVVTRDLLTPSAEPVGKDETSPAAHLAANAPGATPKTHKETVESARVEQNEFTFGEIEGRGLFEKADRNLFEGQDLDVPTYLRKGIKIAL